MQFISGSGQESGCIEISAALLPANDAVIGLGEVETVKAAVWKDLIDPPDVACLAISSAPSCRDSGLVSEG